MAFNGNGLSKFSHDCNVFKCSLAYLPITLYESMVRDPFDRQLNFTGFVMKVKWSQVSKYIIGCGYKF